MPKQPLVSIQSQPITIEIPAGTTGEPKAVTKEAVFEGIIAFAWYTVQSVEMQFSKDGNNEKPIHEWLYEITKFEFKPGDKKVSVSARAGLRDGSGKWDDEYGAKITVVVTALLQ
jgi:hypothetical protein